MEMKPWKNQDQHSYLKMSKNNDIETPDTKNKYLDFVRRELEMNPAVRVILESEDASSIIEKLSTIISGNDISDDAELQDAISKVYNELSVMKEVGKSLYFIDESNGKAIALQPGSIYQPPDVIQENGEVRRPLPILHPGISSTIGMTKAGLWRKDQAIALSKSKEAVEHLLDPEKMVSLAIAELEKSGISISRIQLEKYEYEITFGREHINGIFQSPNSRFHRTYAFKSIIIKRILAIAEQGSVIKISKIKECSNGKQKWFSIGIELSKSKMLTQDSNSRSASESAPARAKQNSETPDINTSSSSRRG